MRFEATLALSIGLKESLRRSTLRHIFHGQRILLHVFVVPAEISFISIFHIARARDAVKFVWIDHELCVDPQAA